VNTINKKNTFNSVFEIDETYENNNWLRVKIRTFAFGKNRNGSDILDASFTGFTKAKASVGAIPIVAKYNDESDNLEGHNVALRKNKDDEYEIFHDTDALGFTSPTSNFYLEEVNEGTGTEPDYKTYVVIEDVYLWKRFDATKKIIEWFAEGTIPTVSMEIDEVEGQFDNDGYFQIQDFSFIGIAALGTDVEPCFKKAEIQMYTTNDFRSDLKALMLELGDYSLKEGGNTEMPEKNKKIEAPEQSTLDKFTVAEYTEAHEMNVQFDSDLSENLNGAETNTKETKPVESKSEKEEDKMPENEFNIQEYEETLAQVQQERDDLAEKVRNLEEEVKNLSEERDTLRDEIRDVREADAKRERMELAEKFASQLTKEEIEKVFEDSSEASAEEIETKLFALIGKNYSIKKPSAQAEGVKLPNASAEIDNNPFKALEKYSK